MADDIVLNLHTPAHRFNETTLHHTNKITGNRGQRIKARKALKRLKSWSHEKRGPTDKTDTASQKQQDIVIKDDTASKLQVSLKESPSQGSKQTKDDPAKPRHSSSKPFISSLFKNNPDIPEVKMPTAEKVTETLFSSGSFAELQLHPYMVANIEKLGFTTMTSVQQQTIPSMLQGRDLLIRSQTGSGKTMAYAIPIIQELQARQPLIHRADGLAAVIVVPTRELATQSYETFQKLLQPFTRIVPGCIMGGERRKAEKARLRKGVNILVATPGRLLDHIENTQSLGLDKVTWLVLDEADRLLDMGYERDVAKLIDALEKASTDVSRRQTVLLSATLSDGVERLAGMSLKNPEHISVSPKDNTCHATPNTTTTTTTKNQSKSVVGKQTGNQTTNSQEVKLSTVKDTYAIPEQLQQYFLITPCKLRLVTLTTFVLSKCKKGKNAEKIIVFLSTQDSVEFHYRLLHYLCSDPESSDMEEDSCERETSLCLCRLHGDMLQKCAISHWALASDILRSYMGPPLRKGTLQHCPLLTLLRTHTDRTTAYEKFCATKSGVLLCTDVAARGLHLPSINWVVQYSSPASHTDYVHRVGRTARVGSVGKALLFLLPTETDFVKTLNEEKISLKEMRMGEILTSIPSIVPFLPGTEETQRRLPRTTEEAATSLQLCCENYVLHGKTMMHLAKKAYQSYVRAYATYPAVLKSIFHVRNLHLGHVAKSFALREAPSNISGIHGVRPTNLAMKRKKSEKDRSAHKRRKVDPLSEFTSSLVFTAKMKSSQKGKRPKKKKIK